MAATKQELTVAEQEMLTARIDEEALTEAVRCYSIPDLPDFKQPDEIIELAVCCPGFVLEYPLSDFFSLFSSTPTIVSCSIFHIALCRCRCRCPHYVDAHIMSLWSPCFYIASENLA